MLSSARLLPGLTNVLTGLFGILKDRRINKKLLMSSQSRFYLPGLVFFEIPVYINVLYDILYLKQSLATKTLCDTDLGIPTDATN